MEKINSFCEKLPGNESGYINAGIYALESEMLRTIPNNRPVSLETEVFPQWVVKGMYAMRHEGFFIDIGTPESYRIAGAYFRPVTDRQSKARKKS